MPRRVLQKIIPKAKYDRLFAKKLKRERIILIFKTAFATIFGREITCHLCNKRLTRAVSFVHNGRLHLWGIHLSAVRVDFEDRLTLRFSHAAPGDCAAQRHHA